MHKTTLKSIAPWAFALIPLACGVDPAEDSLSERIEDISDAPIPTASTVKAVDHFAPHPVVALGGGAPGDAQIRVAHSSPDAPPVDIYIEGLPDPVITNLGYAEATEYLMVPPGDYNFQIRAAGAAADSAPVYETGALPLPMDGIITAVAAGLLGSVDPSDSFRVLPVVENFAPTAPDEARIRVVHASPDAPEVDLDVGDDGAIELAGLGRFSDTDPMGGVLPADTSLQLGIVAGGERLTGFTIPELPGGSESLVIATGLTQALPREDEGFNLLVVLADGSTQILRQNPVVYALHAGPDAPAVDICVGGSLLLDNVAFGELGRIQVPPATYVLDIFVAGNGCIGAPAASPQTPALEPGQQYLAMATGELAPETGDPNFALQAYAENFYTRSPQYPILSIIHGASAPAVDIGVVVDSQIPGEALLATDLAWSEATNAFRVAEGIYPIGIAAAGSRPPLSALVTYDIPGIAGFRGWVLATGALDPAVGETAFQLTAIDTSTNPWSLSELSPQ